MISRRCQKTGKASRVCWTLGFVAAYLGGLGQIWAQKEADVQEQTPQLWAVVGLGAPQTTQQAAAQIRSRFEKSQGMRFLSDAAALRTLLGGRRLRAVDQAQIELWQEDARAREAHFETPSASEMRHRILSAFDGALAPEQKLRQIAGIAAVEEAASWWIEGRHTRAHKEALWALRHFSQNEPDSVRYGPQVLAWWEKMVTLAGEQSRYPLKLHSDWPGEIWVDGVHQGSVAGNEDAVVHLPVGDYRVWIRWQGGGWSLPQRISLSESQKDPSKMLAGLSARLQFERRIDRALSVERGLTLSCWRDCVPLLHGIAKRLGVAGVVGVHRNVLGRVGVVHAWYDGQGEARSRRETVTFAGGKNRRMRIGLLPTEASKAHKARALWGSYMLEAAMLPARSEVLSGSLPVVVGVDRTRAVMARLGGRPYGAQADRLAEALGVDWLLHTRIGYMRGRWRWHWELIGAPEIAPQGFSGAADALPAAMAQMAQAIFKAADVRIAYPRQPFVPSKDTRDWQSLGAALALQAKNGVASKALTQTVLAKSRGPNLDFWPGWVAWADGALDRNETLEAKQALVQAWMLAKNLRPELADGLAKWHAYQGDLKTALSVLADATERFPGWFAGFELQARLALQRRDHPNQAREALMALARQLPQAHWPKDLTHAWQTQRRSPGALQKQNSPYVQTQGGG